MLRSVTYSVWRRTNGLQRSAKDHDEPGPLTTDVETPTRPTMDVETPSVETPSVDLVEMEISSEHSQEEEASDPEEVDLVEDHTPSSLARFLHTSDTNTTQAEPQQGTASTQTNENSEGLAENDVVSPDFVNRNPRNLERMAVARKDRGWNRSHPNKYYWHKVLFEKSNRHITAYIQHYNGSIVVSASTKEWAIKKHLYSTADVAAAENIGRILAQRCLQCGVSYVKCHIEEDTRAYERVDAFITALKEGGIVLTEPKQITDFTRPIDYFPENY